MCSSDLGDDNPYTVAAVASLREALRHGNMGHTEIATGRVNQGLMHLQVAVPVDRALLHGAQAVSQGNMGRMPLFHTHAEQALAHARAAAEIADSAHINLAIEGFEEAIMHGEMEHSGPAVKSAETAMSHLHM